MPVVEATANMTASRDKNLAANLEALHVAVVEDCMKNNITDPEEIKARKLAAHAEYMTAHRAAVNEASTKASQPKED